MRSTGVWSRYRGFQPHDLHEPLDPPPVDRVSFVPEQAHHLSRSEKLRLQMLLVDDPHQLQSVIIFTHRLIIVARSRQRNELALVTGIEELDLEVLCLNDWGKYRPELVVAEVCSSTFSSLVRCEIFVFMLRQDYDCIAWLRPSIVFCDKGL